MGWNLIADILCNRKLVAGKEGVPQGVTLPAAREASNSGRILNLGRGAADLSCRDRSSANHD